MAVVKVIPSTINRLTQMPLNKMTKRKVAAYARVSTDSDEQYTSYDAQVKYYSNYIKSKADWSFVKVYADEGISGTSIKNRTGFKQMISDCENGDINLIITKSISRFARNTLDTITYTRKLKEIGVEVYFEKENLYSLDDKAEFLLTIMASIAQEESRSISQNVTLGMRWAMQEGKIRMGYKNFLGYKKVNGKIEIEESQAEIIRRIYRRFLIDGCTPTGIAKELKEDGISTPAGKNCNWSVNNIVSILQNEKYKGDALLQKTYTKSYLDHKVAKNNGELPQYYVENSHPAIITKENWEQVQVELERRKKLGYTYSSSNVFASKLVCEDCGSFYGKKTWHKGTKYENEIFQCNKKFDIKSKSKKCETPHLTEKAIKEKFVNGYNNMMIRKESILNDLKAIIDMLTNTDEFDNDIASIQNEIEIITEKVKILVNDNSKSQENNDAYLAKYNDLVNRFEISNEKLNQLIKDKKTKETKRISLKCFYQNFEETEQFIYDWDEKIWMMLVEKGTVHKDETITFKLYNGFEFTN